MTKQAIGVEGQLGLSYKYQRVRERLRQAVESGELTGKLPGERELSKRYGANPKTLNKALTDLAVEGLLVRHVGRGTFVAGEGARSESPNGVPQQAMTYGYLVPSVGLRACAEELYKRTSAVLEPLGHRLEQLTVPVETSGELSGRRLSADRLRAFDGLALFGARPSAALLASTNREHLPLIMVNNQHGQVRTAAVLVDYAQGAFELCQYLIHLGHCEIRLCVDPSLMPAAGSAETGYRAAMLRHGLTVHRMQGADAPFDAEGVISPEKGNAPTAVICVGMEIVSPLTEAASAKTANVLSVCCIPEPCDTSLSQQQLTSYEVDPGQVAKWIAELLISASPTRWQRVVIIPGRIIDRGSALPLNATGRTHSPETVVL